MKSCILALFALSSLYSASPELSDTSSENLALELPAQQEIVSLETPSIDRLAIGPNNMTFPAIQPAPIKKEPWVAVTLSSIFPGLGHVYLDDMSTAGGLMGTTGLGLGVLLQHNKQQSLRCKRPSFTAGMRPIAMRASSMGPPTTLIKCRPIV